MKEPGEAGRLLWFSGRESRGAIDPSAERKTRIINQRRSRKNKTAFTLLEVLVAIAILGLGLTVILSSQAGLFSGASRGEHLTVASNLLRCKMSEIELDLAQKGFSLTDENDEGGCCDDEGEGYSCSWKIERVELPPLPESSATTEGGGTDEPATLGPLDALANLQASAQGTPTGEKPDPAAIMEQLTSSSSGMEGLVMSFVYPSLKPMLEASIRRVTVKIVWKEGERERDLEITQFITRPQEGELGTGDQLGLDPNDPNAGLPPGIGQLLGGGATTPGATTPGAAMPTSPFSPTRPGKVR